MSHENEQHPAPPAEPRKRRRFRWRRWLAACVLLAAVLWLLPSIVSITPLRNVVLDALIGDADWQASAERVSLSWVAPLAIDDLRMMSREESSRVVVDSLVADKPWWRLMWERPALGQLAIDKPQLDLLLGDPMPLARRRPDPQMTMAAIVTDAGVTLRMIGQDDPPIDMAGLDVTVRIEQVGDGRELIVEPTTLFAQQELTEDLCSRGLHLVAPILAEVTRVEGQFSLRLDECQIPLDLADRRQVADAQVSGQLDLHRVEIGVKNPLLSKLVGLISRLVDVQVPDTVRIAEESAIAFRLVEGRFYHDGLAFGLPTVSDDLVFRTSGTVGLDETLDLLVEVPLLGEVLGEGPIARRLAGRKLLVEVGGTIEDPQLSLPKGELLLQRLLAGLIGDEEVEPADVAEAAESAIGIARDLLAARRAARRAEAAPPPATDDRGTAAEADQAHRVEEPTTGRPARRPIRRLLDQLFDSPDDPPDDRPAPPDQ